jgi:opacity protein-like surface antigen
MKFQLPWLGAILLLVCFAAVEEPVLADGIEGLYVGVGAGVAKIATDNSAYQVAVQNSIAGLGTLNYSSASLHDRKTALWANVGYMAWPYIGIDVSYLHLGELYNQVKGTFVGNDGTSTFVGAATRLASQGPAVGLLFRVPVSENFALNLRVADYYARTKLINILNSTGYLTTTETASKSSLLAGLGASYVFAGHWSARLDYLRIQHAGDSATGTYNAGILALGASYTF